MAEEVSWRRFSRTLGGDSTKHGYYGFEADADRLRVAYRSEEVALVDQSAKGFWEGLWRYDCGELFLLQPSTGRYLEINLAPTGAWWSCVFRGIRSRDLDCPPPTIRVTNAEILPSGWTASFELDITEIERCLGSAYDLRGNITLILGGCPDDAPPLDNLHTLASLGAVDFHRPQEWLPIEELST